ncbi:MAG: site-specific integrase [Planctomycetota bacterium]|nr:site-specific integrase [Planctomycetota bacterium]
MPTFADSVDMFLDYLAHERKVSENTLRSYSSDMAGLLDWADENGLGETDMASLDSHRMREYLIYLTNGPKATLPPRSPARYRPARPFSTTFTGKKGYPITRWPR